MHILRILTVLVTFLTTDSNCLLAATSDPLDNDNMYEAVVGRHGRKLVFPKASVDAITNASTPVWLELSFASPNRPSDAVVTLRLGGARALFDNGVDVGASGTWELVPEGVMLRVPLHGLKYGAKKTTLWNIFGKFRNNERKVKMRVSAALPVSSAWLRVGDLPPVEPPPDVIEPEEVPVIQAQQITGHSASFSFSAEAGGNFVCSLDGSAFQACASPVTYSALPDGEHVFEVRLLENADNPDGGQLFTFTIDTTRPSVNYAVYPPEPVNSAETVTVTFSSSEAGRALCSIDSGMAIPCWGSFTWYGMTPGRHFISVTVYDVYENSINIDYAWMTEAPPP